MKPERKFPIILDGPVGTELEARGIRLEGPSWSGRAVLDHPEVLSAIHVDYANAGAEVHTAATFRTTHGGMGEEAARSTQEAVRIARHAVPAHHQVFGSLAPLADCYRPWDTPAEVDAPHHTQVEILAGAGVDGVLVETFADPRELGIAVRLAVRTGLPVWASITAGPDGTLLDVPTAVRMAEDAAQAGAEVVLLNCTAIDRIGPFCEAFASTGLPWGVYPNAGDLDGPFARGSTTPAACDPWFDRWLDLGARVVGACCGMGPAQVERISQRAGRATTSRSPGSARPL